MSNQERIGEILIQAGLIDAESLATALGVQTRDGGALGKTLASLGLADEEAVSAAIAKRLRLDFLGSELPEVAPENVSLLPVDFCRKHLIAPLGLLGGSLRLATCDALDYSTIQDVEFLSGREVVAVVASQTTIQTLLDRLHPEENEKQKTYDMLAVAAPEGELEETEEAEYEIIDAAKLAKDTKLPPIVRLVNLILSDAAKAGASDIHIEPNEAGLQVRHRVDGLLYDVLKIPKDLQDATVYRLKIISGMDIAERRKPQDGRCRLRIEGKRIDLRVSTLPTQFGERVVTRLLDSSKAQVPMEQMGFDAENLHVFQACLSRPQGMILVTGPTGSGKTSTLYTALNWVKSRTNNIITVEDPIELQLTGVNQVQINTKAGMTFASGLRSILRQDPDIILVREIRDRETAGIAVEAAQTGHMLLSTLHTNDAPATISRLLDLGIEPFQVGAALIAVLAQRLVRRSCTACPGPQAPSPDAIEKAGGVARLPAGVNWVVGKGCEKCAQTGFRGRVAIHEVLQVNDEMRGMISRRAPEHDIRRAARAAGMKTLMQDGIAKAAQGLTTLEEVVRVAPQDEVPPPAVERRVRETASTAGNIRSEPCSDRVERRASLIVPPVESVASNSPRPYRVLVVEDSPTITSVIGYFLELEGFEVFTAENGLAGLEMAKRELPRVIVSDVNMPGMGGMEMVKELRANSQTHDKAIILLTSESSVESETEGLEAGADDYIVKPVEPRRLAARVKALIARTQARLAAA